MRILFLTQVLPYPLDAGPKIRAYYTLRYLAQKHKVTLVSFVRPNDTDQAVNHLKSFCESVETVLMPRSALLNAKHLLISLACNSPFLIARDYLPEMKERIEQLVRQSPAFEAVHADQLWMAQYALLARQAAPSGRRPLLVLDQHNAVFQIAIRMLQHEPDFLKRAVLALEWRKLARFEIATCQQFDRVVWVTREDQSALEHAGYHKPPAGHDSTIPICIDPEDRKLVRRDPEACRVTFLGGLHYPPNAEGMLWFLREVWPRIAQQAPRAVLTIIGKDPPPAVAHAASSMPNCEVTGYVTDPTPYFAQTGAFIVPLQAGGGMRVKIIDAWCAGLPIISTTIGAEGLSYADGGNLLIADDPESFAASTLRLLREPDLAERLIRAGRQTVAEDYCWSTVYRAWDNVYDNVYDNVNLALNACS